MTGEGEGGREGGVTFYFRKLKRRIITNYRPFYGRGVV